MKHWKKSLGILASGLLLLGAAACSSSDSGAGPNSSTGDSDAGGGDGSDTITLALLADITGGAAFCGAQVQEAFEVAVDYVNERGVAGDVNVVADIYDTATNPEQAATEMSKIASTDALGVVIGCASAVSQAVVPVAQNQGVPVVAMQSGTPAVIEAGDYIFRTTAPQSTYHDIQIEYYAEKGAQRAAIVYQSDNPTLVEIAEDVYPDALADHGMDLVAVEAFEGDGFDFAALATKVVGANPDVVFLFGQGTPNVTVGTQLMQQGYEGFVGGSAGFDGVLDPLGDAANGFTWPADFHAASDVASTQDFVEYFEASTGALPGAFHAQTFDAVLLWALGVAEAGTLDRESVREGIAKVTAEGFDGAVGPLTFEDRDARVAGLLLEWRDGDKHIAN